MQAVTVKSFIHQFSHLLYLVKTGRWEFVVLDDANQILAFIVLPERLASSITECTEQTSQGKFYDSPQYVWDKLKDDVDCFFLTSRGIRLLDIVSGRFASELGIEVTNPSVDFYWDFNLAIYDTEQTTESINNGNN